MFKAGDKVRYVNRMYGADYKLKLGEVYTVKGRFCENSKDIILAGVTSSYDERRFELVPNQGQYIVVKRKSNQLYPATHPATHSDKDKAEQEAKRLAASNPDYEFVVFEAGPAYKATVTVEKV